WVDRPVLNLVRAETGHERAARVTLEVLLEGRLRQATSTQVAVRQRLHIETRMPEFERRLGHRLLREAEVAEPAVVVEAQLTNDVPLAVVPDRIVLRLEQHIPAVEVDRMVEIAFESNQRLGQGPRSRRQHVVDGTLDRVGRPVREGRVGDVGSEVVGGRQMDAHYMLTVLWSVV